MKDRFLLFLVLSLFVFIPYTVKAEGNAIEDINMYMDDIIYGEKPENYIDVSALHLAYSNIPVTWYESTNGIDYTLMDNESTFVYNTYYKVVFGKTFNELSRDMDEGWEANRIHLEIYNDMQKVDEKKYSLSDTSEYTFDPIWKYKISYQLEGLTYEGTTEILENEFFSVRLIPKKNYRLPNNDEVKWEYKLIINGSGYGIEYSYNDMTGHINILPENMRQDIVIMAVGIEKEKLYFDSGNIKIFTLNSNQESLKLTVNIDDNENFDKVYVNEIELDTNNYEINQDTGVLTLHKDYLETLSTGDYILRIEGNDSYSETTITIKSKTYRVMFDANEGTFKDGNTFTIDKWENGFENLLEKPTRDGYTFKGYFTEKIGGTKLESILTKSGIVSNMTFYAQWEENSVVTPDSEEENPKTFDGIERSIIMGTISIIGLVSTATYLKRKNKVRAN